MSQKPDFDACEICRDHKWEVARFGPVRDGKFGSLTPDTLVGRCRGCGVERLIEASCKGEEFYETTAYRLLVNADSSIDGYFAEHDPLQLERLNVFPPHQLRGKNVADVGCAAGTFLDHVRGLARNGIAVEPAQHYHRSLESRGYSVHASLDAAVVQWSGKVDACFSFSVIEHVAEPRAFLEQARELLAPDGELIISTPNRDDIMMELLPDDYPSFFYRTVHRWYFDRQSLAECARHAGLKVRSLKCVHRFGLSNAALWLRDRRPSGRGRIAGLDDAALDANWRIALEREFKGDYLYVVLARQ
ncbi:MAG: class I SAM-dependent methyltransferase [Gammaproteobacteria bacterium]|nr:class I SAM-dependent methyltransferase [Gammaproteobacteria bacterium]